MNPMQALALVQAILGAVQKGRMLAADARALFQEAGIPDEKLLEVAADYGEMIRSWEERAAEPDAEPGIG